MKSFDTLTYSPYVLLAVLGGKTKVLAETHSDVVSVQYVRGGGFAV